MPVRALAMPTPRRLPMPPPPEHLKVAKRAVTDHDDIGATPTIATIRPTARHMRLTPERNRSVAAATGLNKDASPILKHAGTLGLVGSR